jgi:hypothetical protein
MVEEGVDDIYFELDTMGSLRKHKGALSFGSWWAGIWCGIFLLLLLSFCIGFTWLPRVHCLIVSRKLIFTAAVPMMGC